MRGLSPRVRGNLQSGRTGEYLDRSIPACTGEPGLDDQIRQALEVYPRVYGGTYLSAYATSADLGLSPRVRGNLVSVDCCSNDNRVYPRVYGGTCARVLSVG